eukprot:TRINITY_DN3324_c0_g2_i1.p1 TRINITY_DN3324_c0_g2~~TRINITY_DN3324_c0_g2_i1.p1  ORF type:complete len:262 (+),score=22.40 TRINITY_DN3324_c0_g2_i1:46-831(+)
MRNVWGVVCILWISVVVVFGQNYSSSDYVLKYSLDGVVNMRLVPKGAIDIKECLTGLCPHNFVSNVYLGELISGNPCSLAENLMNRNLISLFTITGTRLSLSVATLFHAIYNSRDECISNLQCEMNNTARLLAKHNTANLTELDVNIIETDDPGFDLNQQNCTTGQAIYCANFSKTIVNYILPSFCNSGCVEPRPLTCYPVPPAKLDYVLYRYELLKAAARISRLQHQAEQYEGTAFSTVNSTGGSIGSCISAWEEALISK